MIFFIISRSFLLRMKNVLDKLCRENQKTHFMLHNIYRKLRRLRDNVEKYGRAGQVTDDSMARAHCILNNNTHSGYVILLLLQCNKGCTDASNCYVTVHCLYCQRE